MAQNKHRFIDFITNPLWAFLAAIATIFGFIFAVYIWIVPSINHSDAGQSTATISSTQTPTIAVTTPIPTVDPMSASSLIPNYSPVLTDSLDNPNDPNQWSIGLNGTATCSFDRGALHMLAPANTGGGECNTQAANTNFTNFVYQVKMTILEGLDQQGGLAHPFA